MHNDLINNNMLQEEENFNIKKEVALLWLFLALVCGYNLIALPLLFSTCVIAIRSMRVLPKSKLKPIPIRFLFNRRSGTFWNGQGNGRK